MSVILMKNVCVTMTYANLSSKPTLPLAYYRFIVLQVTCSRPIFRHARCAIPITNDGRLVHGCCCCDRCYALLNYGRCNGQVEQCTWPVHACWWVLMPRDRQMERCQKAASLYSYLYHYCSRPLNVDFSYACLIFLCVRLALLWSTFRHPHAKFTAL